MNEHTADCAWTLAACEYKATHHYCPHVEHMCSCPSSEPPYAPYEPSAGGQEQVRAAREALIGWLDETFGVESDGSMATIESEARAALGRRTDAFEAAVRADAAQEPVPADVVAHAERAVNEAWVEVRATRISIDRERAAREAADRALLDKDKRIEQLESLIARACVMMPSGQPETREMIGEADARHERMLRAALGEPPADSPALCTCGHEESSHVSLGARSWPACRECEVDEAVLDYEHPFVAAGNDTPTQEEPANG